MKLIFTLLIAMTAAATASAGSVITAVVNNGSWASASTWNLNRVPQHGDTIIIPGNNSIAVTGDENLNGVLMKIWGALNLSNGSKINLDNAGVIRVFSGGTITGAGNNDQIRIGNSQVFKGNDPDITGPMFADSTTGNGFAPMSILPVTFSNFYVAKENSDIKIVWSTATENNTDRFEVERSYDGVNWITIGVITAIGNSNATANYFFYDKKMNAPLAYYRIKQTDIDGRFTYTAVRSIKNSEKNTGVEIFAGKNRSVTVVFEEMKSTASVKIFNLNGQEMMKQTFKHSAYITLRLANATPGIYVVHVMDENNQIESKKIVLN